MKKRNRSTLVCIGTLVGLGTASIGQAWAQDVPAVGGAEKDDIMEIIALHLDHKPRFRMDFFLLVIQVESPSNPFHAFSYVQTLQTDRTRWLDL